MMDIEPYLIFQESVEALLEGFIEHLPKIILALFTLLVTLIVARVLRMLVSGFMSSLKTRLSLKRLAKNLIGIVSWVFGLGIATIILFPSVTPGQFFTGLGLTSVAIGFAFKDIFENFIAGVIILLREKMRIGDVIDCEGVSGRVEDILVRETHVRQTDGELVIVPNAFLFKNPLNIQTDTTLVRQTLTVGVDYDTNLEAATELLSAALKDHSHVDQDKTTDVAVTEFGGSSINFELFWWSSSEPAEQRRAFHAIALSVKAALDGAGISIPYPQTTLSVREGHQIVRKS